MTNWPDELPDEPELGTVEAQPARAPAATTLTVVMAAKGYPGDYAKGTRIEGLDDAAKIEGVEIFHAGTVAKDGAILANGGRVLNVCASAKTVSEAQRLAYEAVDRIKWPDGFCRRDIAWQAVEQERADR